MIKKNILEGHMDKLKSITNIFNYLKGSYMNGDKRNEYYDYILSLVKRIQLDSDKEKKHKITLVQENKDLQTEITELKGKLVDLTSEHNRQNVVLDSKALLNNQAIIKFLEGFIEEIKTQHAECKNDRYRKGLLVRFAFLLSMKKQELSESKKW